MPSPWPRTLTRPVTVGDLQIGGSSRVTVQTMTKTDTCDVAATVDQIRLVAAAGADIARVAIPNDAAAATFGEIVAASPVPVVADIHFDWRLAIKAAEAGAAKLRINPGNIGDGRKVGEVVAAAKAAGIPIRVGVNSGSVEKDLLEKHGHPSAEALCESALRSVGRLERLGFEDLIVSIKASDVARTVAANRLFSAASQYPLHLGITEAGFGESGVIKSSCGLAILLAEGIGDTLRVSLTDPPVDEVRAGRQILLSLGLLSGPQLVSCPTCGRCKQDMTPITRAVAEALQSVRAPLVVAVMGCEVNGPGEAREADIGLAAGGKSAVLFRCGEQLGTWPIAEAVDRLISELRALDATS